MDEVGNVMITCRDLKPTAFNPRAGGSEEVFPIVTHFRLMAQAFVTIARRGMADNPVAAEKRPLRADAVARAFLDAINTVERQAREFFAAIQLPCAGVCTFRALVRRQRPPGQPVPLVNDRSPSHAALSSYAHSGLLPSGENPQLQCLNPVTRREIVNSRGLRGG